MSSPHSQQPQHVVLGVTGGIAAYKSPEIVRRLVDGGAQVQVVMTRAARQFISPTALQAVSGRRVRTALWDDEAEAAMGHIELARWADVVVVAPATAHFMAGLAGGFAGDLLSTLCLATEAPVVLVPAMNRAMWANTAVQANAAVLQARGIRLLGPGSGAQACGEHGLGRMLEPEAVVAALSTLGTAQPKPLQGIKAVITAGPTREPIDPVRYITNRSSGKMGFAIAAAARDAGADVVLVSGPVSLAAPPGVRRIDVETARQMFDAVHREIGDARLFIACAAVSDYRPLSAAPEKIKRSSESMQLELVRSPDTLASVAALPDGPFTVGFAAETQHLVRYAREKLTNKGLDMIAANLVGPGCGFDRETNALKVFWRDGEIEMGESSKADLARRLVALIAEHMGAARSAEPAPVSDAGE